MLPSASNEDDNDEAQPCGLSLHQNACVYRAVAINLGHSFGKKRAAF